MKIRPAVPGDLEAGLEMLRCAHGALQPATRWHAGAAASTLQRLMADPAGYAVVLQGASVVGISLGCVGPALWQPGVQASNLLRWVAPAQRGAWHGPLLRHFEDWARAQGASLIGVSQTGRIAARAYERQGYAPAEHMYFRNI